jgi:hypothetical protein
MFYFFNKKKNIDIKEKQHNEEMSILKKKIYKQMFLLFVLTLVYSCGIEPIGIACISLCMYITIHILYLRIRQSIYDKKNKKK